MGLEIFSLHNKVVSQMEGKMRDTNGRLYFGGLVMLVYLLIGAIVFVRLEYPLERIERETHWEYRDQWTERLTAAGIEGELAHLILSTMIFKSPVSEQAMGVGSVNAEMDYMSPS